VDIYKIEAVIKITFKVLEFKKFILNDKKTLFTISILFIKIIVNKIIPCDTIEMILELFFKLLFIGMASKCCSPK
tara:strand:- start:173 stop:397 length:225 start_codon:yes stop_codon:yes gene_type:complete